jgi:hypothetical protein
LGDNLSEQQKSMMVNYFQEKQILDLPTYNEYFYINNKAAVTDTTSEDTGEVEVTTSVSAQQALQTTQASNTGY